MIFDWFRRITGSKPTDEQRHAHDEELTMMEETRKRLDYVREQLRQFEERERLNHRPRNGAH